MIFKPIPQLRSQRTKIDDDNVPDINLKIGYMNKESKEVTIINSDKVPKKQFNPREYEKLFEVATVQVIIYDPWKVKSKNNCQTKKKLN